MNKYKYKYTCTAKLRSLETDECLDTCEMSIEAPFELDLKQQYACMTLINGLDSDDETYWQLTNMMKND